MNTKPVTKIQYLRNGVTYEATEQGSLLRSQVQAAMLRRQVGMSQVKHWAVKIVNVR